MHANEVQGLREREFRSVWICLWVGWLLTCSVAEYEAQSSQMNWLQLLHKWQGSLEPMVLRQMRHWPMSWGVWLEARHGCCWWPS